MFCLLDLCAFGHIFGVVASRRIDHVRGGAHRVEHRTGPAAAAADQADLDLDVHRRRRVDKRQFRQRGGTGKSHRGLLDELAA